MSKQSLLYLECIVSVALISLVIGQSNVLYNSVLKVQLDDVLPRIASVLYMPSGDVYNGYIQGKRPRISFNNDDIVAIHRSEYLNSWQVVASGTATYTLSVKSSSLSLNEALVSITVVGRVTLDGPTIEWSLDSCVGKNGNGSVYTVHTVSLSNFEYISLLPTDGYFRDSFSQETYTYGWGGGLFDQNFHVGTFTQENIADHSPTASIFVGGWKATSKSGFTMLPSRRSLPFLTQLVETQFKLRAGAFGVGPNVIKLQLRCGAADRYWNRISFFQDLNFDGVVDNTDVMLSLRRQVPDASDIYRKSVSYKLGLQYGGDVDFTPPIITFRRALDYVKMMHDVTDGLPQLVFLVGWQYHGHDTGYPSLSVVNPALGGQRDLLYLMNVSLALYNAQISFHINMDDAYPVMYGQPSPEFSPDFIATDIDGEMYITAHWPLQDPTQTPCYHISKTKDAINGSMFKRLDEFFAVAQPKQAIHADAWRCVNYSWETDGYFIGPDDETMCGCEKQIAYFRKQGLSPGVEGLNGSPTRFPGLVEYVWHSNLDLNYFLWFNKIIIGGSNGNDQATIWGAGIDNDYTGYSNDTDMWTLMTDDTFIKTQLYHLFLSDDWIGFARNSSGYTISRYANGGTSVGLPDEYLNVMWPFGGDLICVAQQHKRFLPRNNNTIYVYLQSSEVPQTQSWELPLSWRGANITADTLTYGGVQKNTPQITVIGRLLQLRVQPGQPIRLTKR